MLADTLKEIEQLQEAPDSDVAANLATRVFFDSALGGGEALSAFIMSREEVLKFRRYETAALNLPRDLEKTENYLGYKEDQGAGLEPTDFFNLFQKIFNHATAWNPLVRKIQGVAGQLSLFGMEMTRFHKSFESLVAKITVELAAEDNIKTFADLLKKYPNVSTETYPGLILNEENLKEQNRELSTILNEMKHAVTEQVNSAQGIQTELAAYGTELNRDIKPLVEAQKHLVMNRMKSEDARILQEKIDQRAASIKEANDSYKAGVGQSVTSALSGSVLLGIYLGVIADGVRKERNKMIAHQDADLEKLKVENKVQRAMASILLRFQELELVISDARSATEKLIDVWNLITTFAEGSQKHTRLLDNASSIVAFSRRMENVCEPWKDIAAKSYALNKVFRDVDLEITSNELEVHSI